MGEQADEYKSAIWLQKACQKLSEEMLRVPSQDDLGRMTDFCAVCQVNVIGNRNKSCIPLIQLGRGQAEPFVTTIELSKRSR